MSARPDLRDALRDLWEAIVEVTRLERFVAWLNRKLGGGNPPAG